MTALVILVNLVWGMIFIWIFAELGSGIFHWWEDRYGNPDWPILGKYIVRPNIEHHISPIQFTKIGYWERNWTTLCPALVAAGICFYEGWYFLTGGFLLMGQSNEIHSWAHQKCSWIIRIFQNVGLLQSPKHHSIHHHRPYSTNYCVLTNYLNPVLNACCFWYGLEKMVYWTIGAKPLPEREIY